jgi:hypothetical protein
MGSWTAIPLWTGKPGEYSSDRQRTRPWAVSHSSTGFEVAHAQGNDLGGLSLVAGDLHPADVGAGPTVLGHAQCGRGLGAERSSAVGASRCRKGGHLVERHHGGVRCAISACLGSRARVVSLPPLPAQRQRFLTLPELQESADAAGDYRLVILVLGLCGLRFGECAALRVRSTDPLRGRLRVIESVSEVGGRCLVDPEEPQSRRCPGAARDPGRTRCSERPPPLMSSCPPARWASR